MQIPYKIRKVKDLYDKILKEVSLNYENFTISALAFKGDIHFY